MTIENILALGFLPAVFTTGHWLQSKLFDFESKQWDALSFWTQSALLGLSIWLPILIAAAWIGIFNAAWIGAAGWIVSALGLFKLQKVKTSPLDATAWLAIAFALMTFAWNATYSNESLATGRDQGVYSNQAVVIAKTGSLYSQELFENQFDQEYHHLVRGNQSGGLYFVYEKKHIVFQFAPAFASLLAQGYGISGYNGLFAVNPLLSSLAGLFLFALLRLVVPGRWAFFGLLCFSLNLVQFWNARITLSEILAQIFLLGGLLTTSNAWKNQSFAGFIAGCSLIALNSAIRIDGYLAVIGVGIAIILFRLSSEDSSDPRKRAMLRWGAIATILSSIATILFIAYSSPIYFKHHSFMIFPLFGVAIATCALATIKPPSKLRDRVSKLLSHRITFWLITGIVSIVLIYAYFIRPHQQPYALLPAGHPAAGTRDFRENSLVDLGAYLSPIVIVLAAIGFLSSLRQAFRGSFQSSFLIGPILIFSMLYLYNPSVSPDHIWRMRRFTPMVIPGFIAFAAIGSYWSFSRFQRSRAATTIAGTALGALLLTHYYKTGNALAFTKQNEGFSKFIEEVAAAIPPHAVVFTDVDIPLLGPLQLGRDYEVIRGHPNYPPHIEYIPKLAKRLMDEGKNLYLLSSKPQFSKAMQEEGTQFTHTSIDTFPTTSPFPVDLRKIHNNLYLSKLPPNYLGYRDDDPAITIGATPILGIEESGMFGQETSGDSPFRWSEKIAEFSMPWIFDHPPVAITLAIGGCKPGGTNLVVKANGARILSKLIKPNEKLIEVPIDQIDWSQPKLELQLQCDPWIPSEHNKGSNNNRELGIQLFGIDIKLQKDGLLENVSFGNTPTNWIQESGLHDVELIDTKKRRWTNGSASFQFELKPRYTPEALDLKIRSKPPQSTKLAIFWNDTPIYQTPDVQAPESIHIDLPANLTESTKVVNLRIESDTFIPSEIDPTSNDNRKLGVMIESIDLH